MASSISEEDIRPSALMQNKAWAVDHDRNYLLERRGRFVTVRCPACDSSDSTLWGEKEGFSYRQCTQCASQFMSPRAPEDVLADFYGQSQNYKLWNESIFPATEKTRMEKIFRPRAKQTVSLCQQFQISGGTLLEIGAAFGTYCEALRDTGFFQRIVAVEPTPDLAQTCRSKGFETFEQTMERLSFPEAGADVVAAFEVLEHLFEPDAFMKRAAHFLRPGGLLICSCPNGLALGTLALGVEARVVDHEHLNYLNPGSILKLLQRCHLECLVVTTPGEMDVNLLLNQLHEQPTLKILSPLIAQLGPDPDLRVQVLLQEFLKEARLSSHMWFVARKPAHE